MILSEQLALPIGCLDWEAGLAFEIMKVSVELVRLLPCCVYQLERECTTDGDGSAGHGTRGDGFLAKWCTAATACTFHLEGKNFPPASTSCSQMVGLPAYKVHPRHWQWSC